MTNELLPTTHTLQEILTQAPVWRAALHVVARKLAALKALWTESQADEIIVTGCGSTYNLSMAVAPLLQQQLRVRARAVPASELLYSPEQVLAPGTRPLLLTLSRSGYTTETIQAASQFQRELGRPVVHIGCDANSPLARLSDFVLTVDEGQEQSVVQTRSFSAMTVTAQAMASALADERQFEAMQVLPELGEHLISTFHALARELGEDQQIKRFYFLGSGLQYGLACEANLKMKEMSLSVAEAFHFMEFRHGPMSMVDQQTLVVGLVSETQRASDLAVLREMRALGGKTLVLAERPLEQDVADYPVVFGSNLAETQRAVLYLPVLQLLGYYRALSNGQNPDAPRNLTAVIRLDTEQDA